MKQKNSYHINIGGASVLLILSVFSLTIFAVLSFRASYHEAQMANKTKESVENYYVADSKAEEMLMVISELVRESGDNLNETTLKEKLTKAKEVQYDPKLHCLTYQVAVDYNKVIEVRLQLPVKNGQEIKINSYRLLNDNLGGYDDFQDEELWDGTLDE